MCLSAYADSDGPEQIVHPQGLRCPQTEPLDTLECFNGLKMPVWVFAHVQDYLTLCILRMFECTFSLLTRPKWSWTLDLLRSYNVHKIKYHLKHCYWIWESLQFCFFSSWTDSKKPSLLFSIFSSAFPNDTPFWIQSSLNSSNTDGSFTMANSKSFLNPYEILPIALGNKYLRKLSYFIIKLYVVCTH